MRASLAAAVALLTLALAACTPATTGPAPIATAQEPAASASETAAADPELDAFLAALEGGSPLDPDAVVAAVEAAGFDRAMIERTREVDSLGAPVTLMQVAARAGEDCLVGQVGDGAPEAQRVAPLASGRCLIGAVVTVD